MTHATPAARLAHVKSVIRAPYAWPGGYPRAVLCSDGGVLCPDCARAEFRNIADSTLRGIQDGWNAADSFINWAEPGLACDHCGEAIPSAYGAD